ncbi:MAG: hypothetical protein ACLPX8_03805 [Bryobacteraceae bacterium]
MVTARPASASPAGGGGRHAVKTDACVSAHDALSCDDDHHGAETSSSVGRQRMLAWSSSIQYQLP